MKKHKRIKALPVCSETLKKICAINQNCKNYVLCSIDGKTCPAYIEGAEEVYSDGDCICHNVGLICECAEYDGSGRGCPLFRKVGE